MLPAPPRPVPCATRSRPPARPIRTHASAAIGLAATGARTAVVLVRGVTIALLLGACGSDGSAAGPGGSAAHHHEVDGTVALAPASGWPAARTVKRPSGVVPWSSTVESTRVIAPNMWSSPHAVWCIAVPT